MNKYLSRKFLIAFAAMLASIGTSIAGLHTGEGTVATVGIICTIVSAAIYAFAEAYVDGKAVCADCEGCADCIGFTVPDDSPEE